jgi:hypothetical protein
MPKTLSDNPHVRLGSKPGIEELELKAGHPSRADSPGAILDRIFD